jgi:Ca2+-binding RTX toxin-like protein
MIAGAGSFTMVPSTTHRSAAAVRTPENNDMNTTPRTIARLALMGGLVASAAAIVPGVAGAAGCTGKTVYARANYTTLHGTSCNDTFYIGRYAGVTIYAGDGNDTVNAGFIGNSGTNYFYLQGGNDTVVNPHDKPIWVSGGAGNDVMDGSSGYDAFYGGTGTDSISATPGDFYAEVEKFF